MFRDQYLNQRMGTLIKMMINQIFKKEELMYIRKPGCVDPSFHSIFLFILGKIAHL